MDLDRIFIVIVSVIVILLMIQWCISVVKYLIIPNWEKIKDAIILVLGYIGVTIGFVILLFMFFHDCKGCDNRRDTIDHIHFEKY